MNKVRRKELAKLLDRTIEIKDCLEAILNDEESYRDNIPENLQSSDNYEKSGDACSLMEDALNLLDEAVQNIDAARG